MQIKIILLVLIFSNVNLQNQVIKLDEFYIGEGVIINDYENFPFLFSGNNYQKKYSVSIDEAIEAEKFIITDYYKHKLIASKHFGIEDKNIEKFKDPKKVKRRFRWYNRQYSGYIDENNDTIIYIGMLNFSNRRKAKLYFDGWKDFLLLGNGDWYYANQEFFIYNKSKRRLEDNF